MSWSWFRKIGTVIVIAIIFRSCVLESVRGVDNSMAPTLMAGDIALVSKLSYGMRLPGVGAVIWEWSPIRKNDLVLLAEVSDPPMNLVRRISALPGEKVLLPGEKEPTTIKEGFYFVSAEQKENATDSRQFGVISRRTIVGKVTHIWLPDDSKVKSENSKRSILQRVL